MSGAVSCGDIVSLAAPHIHIETGFVRRHRRRTIVDAPAEQLMPPSAYATLVDDPAGSGSCGTVIGLEEAAQIRRDGLR
jgi:hypothetical protein